MPAPATTPLRVGLLGYGNIGLAVAAALRAGAVPGAALAAVASRNTPTCAEAVTLSQLPGRCDLVVEVAGQEAVRAHAASVLDGGVDLLVVSTGALADEALRRDLVAAGPGRLLISSGAIGGIDLVRAARRAGPLSVRLTTVKAPASLVRPWMPDELATSLRAGLTHIGAGDNDRRGGGDSGDGDSGDRGDTVVFEGGASDAATAFPANANVAATLALAAGDWAAVTVRILARPGTTRTQHRIEIEAATGSYRLDIHNVPSAENPATSRLVADAVLRGVADVAGASGPAFL